MCNDTVIRIETEVDSNPNTYHVIIAWDPKLLFIKTLFFEASHLNYFCIQPLCSQPAEAQASSLAWCVIVAGSIRPPQTAFCGGCVFGMNANPGWRRANSTIGVGGDTRGAPKSSAVREAWAVCKPCNLHPTIAIVPVFFACLPSERNFWMDLEAEPL